VSGALRGTPSGLSPGGLQHASRHASVTLGYALCASAEHTRCLGQPNHGADRTILRARYKNGLGKGSEKTV
jgi:hypothetical protein